MPNWLLESVTQAGGYWVKKGVSHADKVVGDGSFILKAELLKSQSAQEGG